MAFPLDRKEKDLAISPSIDSPSTSYGFGDAALQPPSRWNDFVDSFKPDPNASVGRTPSLTQTTGSRYDIEHAIRATTDTGLTRKLRGRHLQMIAIGGSIGTGLFIGSGSALQAGGPASLLIAFGLVGLMMYTVVHALGEMAVTFPVAGSFSAFSTRFLDPAWGFAMGWNYAMQWLVTLPLEIVGATLTIDYWTGGSINNDAWVIIFLLLIVVINFFGVQGYGEAEFVFSIIKVAAVIGFILLGIILTIAGGPNGSYVGGHHWRDPGAFNNGFKGLCSCFITAAFAFGGTELVGLAAAETENPRRALPTAIKQVFWRITLFYIVSLTLIGLLVPYNDPALLNGGGSAASSQSPFVIAIQISGIAVLPSIFNVVIMIAVISVGNSSVYGSSRTLAALAAQGQAPKILGYIDRRGRPLVAIVIATSLGALAFLAGSNDQGAIFNWLLSISGLSSILTWASICLSHIRFRRGWRLQGHSTDELAFTSQSGVLGSWLGLALNIVVLIAQFWTGFAPINYGSMSASERVQSFFLAYLAVPVVIAFYLPYKLYYKTPTVRALDMDLVSGRRDLDLKELLREERAERAMWPKWKKIYKVFC